MYREREREDKIKIKLKRTKVSEQNTSLKNEIQ